MLLRNTNIPGEIYIDPWKEAYLKTLLVFGFIPEKYSKKWITDKIYKEFLDIGLLWCEETYIGNFIRPLNNIFLLFGQKPYNYFHIDFQITHTINEMIIYHDLLVGSFDSMAGRIIQEFLPSGIYAKFLSGDIENAVVPMVENEFKKYGNRGNKYTIGTYIPDIVLDLSSGLISIEIELTDKGIRRYIDTLKVYAKSQYKKVIWLCDNEKNIQTLLEARKFIKETNCEIIITNLKEEINHGSK